MKNGIINELKFASKKKKNAVLGYVYCDYLLDMFEEIERLNNIIKSARDLFYEKCRISQNGVYKFNQVDYEELDNVLKGVDKE